MFNPSREEARQFFFETWRKHRQSLPITPLEHMALDLLLLHPEYQTILDDADQHLHRDYPPEFGETNPFLHLSMHLAINEQLSIDQPPGIRAAFAALVKRRDNAHGALHHIMDCLAETIWQAQRSGTALDQTQYLDCLRRRD